MSETVIETKTKNSIMKKHTAHIVLTFVGAASLVLAGIALMTSFYLFVLFGLLGAYCNGSILADDYNYQNKKALLNEMFRDCNEVDNS